MTLKIQTIICILLSALICLLVLITTPSLQIYINKDMSAQAIKTQITYQNGAVMFMGRFIGLLSFGLTIILIFNYKKISSLIKSKENI
ncbi:MAG: hypothetical protein COA79_22780 [Planctomycetota bacterium]|nr:MAG: hypothetical protein COA79_22780 [Planctomycetota bacterium]